MLKPGDVMPDFRGQALMPGGEIESLSLASYRNARTLLFFWPLDFTLVCSAELQGYNGLVRQFEEMNCRVLGASVDSVHAHRAWIEHELGKMEFPMIGDIDRSLATGYGVLDAQGVALRATFIMNPKGIIEAASANAANVGRAPAETLRLVAAFQTGKLTGCDWQPGTPFVQARKSGEGI